jgi:hypothetical protein
MPTYTRRGQFTVAQVRKGEPTLARETNAWRRRIADLSLGFNDASEGIHHETHPGGTVISLPQELGGVNVGSGGMRLRCLNTESRTIPQYSVVELDVEEWMETRWQGDGWPKDPRVLVHRPRQAALSARVGWVDEEVLGDAEGTVLVGGWGVVWIYLRKTSWTRTWRGASVVANYQPGNDMFVSTVKGSYRFFTAPVGAHALLTMKLFPETPEPEWGWHPEIDESDVYQRRMGIVQFKSWWG